MDTPIVNEIMKKLGKLPDNLQRRVLTYVEALQIPATRGASGQQLLQFAGALLHEFEEWAQCPFPIGNFQLMR